jgi:hypothetical protein
MCRRATGGPFAVIMWVAEEAVHSCSRLPARRPSSKSAVRAFCDLCGTPLFLKYHGADELGVMVGCFDDPNIFPPQYHYGIEGRLRWPDESSANRTSSCARQGGEGPDTFDALGALEQWVEKGHAPERIAASQLKNGHVERTRPLCPYPQVARYDGKGSADDEASFVCRLQ